MHLSAYNSVWQSLHVSKFLVHKISSIQGTCIKAVCGLLKHHYHSNLLYAIGIKSVELLIEQKSVSLLKNISCIQSPARNLNEYLKLEWVSTVKLYKGT